MSGEQTTVNDTLRSLSAALRTRLEAKPDLASRQLAQTYARMGAKNMTLRDYNDLERVVPIPNDAQGVSVQLDQYAIHHPHSEEAVAALTRMAETAQPRLRVEMVDSVDEPSVAARKGTIVIAKTAKENGKGILAKVSSRDTSLNDLQQAASALIGEGSGRKPATDPSHHAPRDPLSKDGTSMGV